MNCSLVTVTIRSAGVGVCSGHLSSKHIPSVVEVLNCRRSPSSCILVLRVELRVDFTPRRHRGFSHTASATNRKANYVLKNAFICTTVYGESLLADRRKVCSVGPNIVNPKIEHRILPEQGVKDRPPKVANSRKQASSAWPLWAEGDTWLLLKTDGREKIPEKQF